MNDKEKIIKLFKDNVLGKAPDTSNSNQNHDGKKGHWLEEQFGIKRNGNNLPDIYGYELKDDTKSATTFGDWVANRYIYRDGEYEYLFKGSNTIEKRNSFLKIFGKPNPKKKNRCSWSGKACPKIGKYNEFGQKLIVTENNDICVVYSYEKDQRLNKQNIIPKELQNKDEVILAKWFGLTSPSSDDKCIKLKLEDKFHHKGWFKCKKDRNGVYNEICFGDKISFNEWIEWVKNGDVYFDSAMKEDNSKPYSLWRAKNKFWDSLVIDKLDSEKINNRLYEDEYKDYGYFEIEKVENEYKLELEEKYVHISELGIRIHYGHWMDYNDDTEEYDEKSHDIYAAFDISKNEFVYIQKEGDINDCIIGYLNLKDNIQLSFDDINNMKREISYV